MGIPKRTTQIGETLPARVDFPVVTALELRPGMRVVLESRPGEQRKCVRTVVRQCEDGEQVAYVNGARLSGGLRFIVMQAGESDAPDGVGVGPIISHPSYVDAVTTAEDIAVRQAERARRAAVLARVLERL